MSETMAPSDFLERQTSDYTHPRLTEDILDLDRRREEAEAIREIAKQHLSPKVLRSKPDEDWQCELPTFSVRKSTIRNQNP